MAAAPLKVSLTYLAEKGDLAAVKAELRRHPNSKNEKSHDKGMHALTAAVIKKQYEIAQYLLENFSDVDSVDRRGDTALLHACIIGDEKLVQMLLNFGADVNFVGHTSKNTPLFEAISHGFSSVCTLLLDQPSLDLTHRSALGADTALTLAAENGMHEIVEALIEKGADLNATNHWKSSPLIVAIKKGHFEIAKLLARAGADIYHQDSSGMDSLEYLKHNQEQLMQLTVCGESGRAQTEALQRLNRDEENSYTISMVGELQKTNVALHMCKNWGVTKIDQALRIVNMSGKPSLNDTVNEIPLTARKSRISTLHNLSVPHSDLGKAHGHHGRSGSVVDTHHRPSDASQNAAALAALDNDNFSLMLSASGNGRAAAKSINSANSESLPLLQLGTQESRNAPQAKMKDNPLLINFDCAGIKLPSHWLNHIFIRSLKADTHIRSIDLTGNDLNADLCAELIDAAANNDRLKCIRVGCHGLDFDLSKSKAVWFVDSKYFAACDITLLSKVLLTWPVLFVAEDTMSIPAVFCGGSSSSRISPVILEAFDEIVSASDFHPSHIVVPREPLSRADSGAQDDNEDDENSGFIFDLYNYAFWFHIISRDKFATLVKSIATDYPYLAHQHDHLNRTVASQASPECKKKITSATLIYDRYQIHDYKPRHHGATSCMYFAVDLLSEETPHPKVAMKFIKNRSQFDREVVTRSRYKLDYDVILEAYPTGAKKKEFYDSTSAHLGYERLRKFKTEMKRLSTHQETPGAIPLTMDEQHSPLLRLQTMEPSAYERFPYCLVYPKADADLTQIMHHEMSESK
jgi:ankyrin repeat protein